MNDLTTGLKDNIPGFSLPTLPLTCLVTLGQSLSLSACFFISDGTNTYL